MLIALLASMTITTAMATPDSTNPKFTKDIQQQALQAFPPETKIGQFIEHAKAWELTDKDTLVGYLFETDAHVSIPAYSGKPINLAVAIDPEGVFKYAWVIEHHEPILLVGIPEQKLHDFAAQYVNHKLTDRIRVTASANEGEVAVDAVTGATVTVIVVNETILKASHEVAIALGIMKPSAADSIPASKVKADVFSEKSWNDLTGDGTIRRLHLTRGDIDEAFLSTDAKDVDVARANQKQDNFIDLYYTYLNAPTAGKNLLGESEYQWLMSELKEGEHAVAFMANGRYSFRGNGFVRGGIFDRDRYHPKR